MIKSIKVRLLPLEDQEQQLVKSAGTARYIYNWTLNNGCELVRRSSRYDALNKQFEHFEKTGKLNKLSNNELRKKAQSKN